ncbi:MAG TPA: hypothetical protein VKA48_03040, partial [Gammaproteobacteria bacterium]|nr:hypothetical protein [Gammaproteobacteria bacterium]
GKPITAELKLQRNWNRQPNRFLTKSSGGPEGLVRLVDRYTRSHLGAECCVCGSSDSIQMHHVRHVRKMGSAPKGFHRMMANINRKQVPLCKTCHSAVHAGKYDGLKLSDLTYLPQ